MDSPRRQRSIFLCQPHSTTPHPSRVGVLTRLPDALGCCRSAAGGQGATLSTFPRSVSRVNLRVLRPLTREPQGQPSPLRTPQSRPGAQGIFPTSRGQAPHGWPMVHHSLATGFTIPQGCFFWSPIPSHVPLCHIPSPPQSQRPVVFPIPRGSCAAPSHPSSRVYTPPGRLQPCGAGPLDPHPSADRFVRLARVAPFPPPPLSPVPRPLTQLGLFPASRAFPVSWGRRVALATRLFLSRLFSEHPVFLPHRAASNPLARAHWILIHPGTVSCA